jgi:hypothetical protein
MYRDKVVLHKNNTKDSVTATIVGAVKNEYIKVLHDKQILYLVWDDSKDHYGRIFYNEYYYAKYNVVTNMLDNVTLNDYGLTELHIDIEQVTKRKKSGRPLGSNFTQKK